MTALVAIVTVLSGQFGDFQVKVIITTSVISAASICVMSCAAFIEKRGMNPFCFLGIISALAAAALLIFGVWNETDSDQYWKSAITVSIIAIALAQIFLLLLPNLAGKYRWTQVLFVFFISILAVQIIYALWAEVDNDIYYRGVIVVAILVVMMTLIIPVCSKLQGKQDGPADRLILRKTADGIYIDQLGRKLRITEIQAEENQTS